MSKDIGMNNVEAMDIVNSLEKKYPVDTWQHEGIDFWPIIRRTIFNHLRRKKITTKKNTSKRNLVITLPESIYFYFKLRFSNNKCNYIFASNQAQRADLDGLSYNRFADPIMDLLEKEGQDSMVLEVSKTGRYIENIYKDNRFFPVDKALSAIDFYLRMKNKLFKKSNVEFTGYSEFLNELKEHDSSINKKLSYRKITVLVNRMVQYSILAKAFLIRIKPKAVFAISYYGQWNMSLFAASKSLCIPTVDIQHALMYIKQCSYNSFVKVPKKGFNTMPKYFWTWGDFEKTLINEWSVHDENHTALALGNPWVMAFVKNRIPYNGKIDQYLNPNKRLILLSLGNRGEQFPEYFVEFVEKNHYDFQFWIRLHPRQMAFKDEITDQLKEKGIFDLINLEEASNLPLPEILMHSAVHVTLMSSVVIEAAFFGVKSMILHPEGRNYFQNHEVSSFCHFYVPSEDFEKKLIDLIESNQKSPKTEMDFDNIPHLISDLFV